MNVNRQGLPLKPAVTLMDGKTGLEFARKLPKSQISSRIFGPIKPEEKSLAKARKGS